MAKKLTELTDMEKAALAFAYFENVTDAQKIFALGHDMSKYSTNPDVSRNRANEWRRSASVVDYFRTLEAKVEHRIRAEVDAQLKVARTDPSYTPGTVDFTNLDEFFAYANRQANVIEDEKDRQFYLKTIADLMRFKEGAQDKNQDIQRFYTPLLCRDCPLHQRAEAEIAEEAEAKKKKATR